MFAETKLGFALAVGLGVGAAMFVGMSGARANDPLLPSYQPRERTTNERLQEFRPPPPPPREPTVFDRAQGAVTHTFPNGATIRPDVGRSSTGTPTVGAAGTFK